MYPASADRWGQEMQSGGNLDNAELRRFEPLALSPRPKVTRVVYTPAFTGLETRSIPAAIDSTVPQHGVGAGRGRIHPTRISSTAEDLSQSRR